MRRNIYLLSLIKKINTVVLGLLSTVFINRTLGPELLGEYTYIANTINILLNIANFGITTILPNYSRRKEEWVKNTFYSIMFLQFGFYMLLGIFLSLIWNRPVLILYTVVLSSEVLSLQVLNCTIVYDFLISTIANSIAVIVNAAFLFVLFVRKANDVNLVLAALALKSLVAVLICLPSIIKDYRIQDVRLSEWKGILHAGFIPMMISLMTILNYKVDVIELKQLGIASASIGIYAVGLGFADYALIIVDVFKDVLINKTADNDNIKDVCFSLRCSSSLLILAFVGLVIVGKPLIILLYGKEYETAYLITLITMLGVYCMMFLKLLGTLYIAKGEWNYYFKVMLGAALGNIIINYLLIPFWGIYGAAIATIASYSFTGLSFYSRFKKEYNVVANDTLMLKRNDIEKLKSIAKSFFHINRGDK